MNVPLNENFLNEKDIRFEALQQLRDIQAGLVGVSFLPVLAIMRPENEYRKDVIGFQDELDKVVLSVQNFISKVKNDVDYSSEDAEDTEKEPKDDEDTEDTEDTEEEEDGDDTEEEEEDDKKPEDSSEPKE